LIGLAGAAAIVLGVVGFWAIRQPASSRFDAKHFPNVTLVTEDGRPVRFYDDLIERKIVVINFIYSHCGFSCPLETARLAQVQDLLGERMGKDVFFYSISIDPGHDTPEVLKHYAETFHAGPGWMFLTGRREDIDLLASSLGMTDDVSITEGPGADLDGHSPHVLIGNEATGQWLRDSGTDNPRFMANLIGNLVGNGWASSPSGAKTAAATGAPMTIASPGQYLFGKECAACHTIGHGDKIGPDLAEIASIRDPDWLARYITGPDKMLAAGDPIAVELNAQYQATMPNLRVSDHDAALLIDFLTVQASRHQPAASPQTPTPPAP
jgi:protein SCO1/2